MTKKRWLATLAALVLALPLAAAEMTEGVVRKVDRDTGKVALKHGEIKHLDMPPMTMVFQARDPALLDGLKPGDKVLFSAETTAGGALVVTRIEPAP